MLLYTSLYSGESIWKTCIWAAKGLFIIQLLFIQFTILWPEMDLDPLC